MSKTRKKNSSLFFVNKANWDRKKVPFPRTRKLPFFSSTGTLFFASLNLRIREVNFFMHWRIYAYIRHLRLSRNENGQLWRTASTKKKRIPRDAVEPRKWIFFNKAKSPCGWLWILFLDADKKLDRNKRPTLIILSLRSRQLHPLKLKRIKRIIFNWCDCFNSFTTYDQYDIIWRNQKYSIFLIWNKLKKVRLNNKFRWILRVDWELSFETKFIVKNFMKSIK